MTDYQKFVELYNSIGIPIKESEWPENRERDNDLLLSAKYILTLEVDWRLYGEKVGGYSDFLTEIIFDSEGKFLQQNIWE